MFLSGIVSLRNFNVTPSNILLNKTAIHSKDGSANAASPREVSIRAGTKAPESLGSAFSPDFYRPSRNFSDTSAIEDLRKRLAMGSAGSTMSLSGMPKQASETESRKQTPIPGEYPTEQTSPNVEFPSPVSSPSVQAKPKPLSRLSNQGVAIGRASPALGKDMTSAHGELNSQSRASVHDEEAGSGAASPRGPASLAYSNVAGVQPSRRFSTNYGEFPSYCQI